MVSGSEVYDLIKEKIDEIESDEKKLSQKVYELESNIDSSVQSREETYIKLANVYLPEMNAEAVKNTLHEFQRDVQRIFNEKQEKRKEIENRILQSSKKKKGLEMRLEEVTSKLNVKASERDKTQGLFGKELESYEGYNELYTKEGQLKETLRRNEIRVQEIKEQSKEKKISYEENKLFMYLVNKSRNSSNGENTGLVNWLDSWVAGIVNFDENKKHYDFLLAMPGLMEEELKARQAKYNKIVDDMSKIEKNIADRIGLTSIIEEGRQIGIERGSLIKNIAQTNFDVSSYAEERKSLDNTKGEYHEKALQKLKDYFKGEDIQYIKKRARETPGTEDDKLVDKIEELDNNISGSKSKIKEVKSRRDAVKDRLLGLRDIINDYTSNDYESERSYFDDDFDISDFLLGYMTGTMSKNVVLEEIEENQHFRPRPTYTPSSSSYSSRSSDDDDDDSWSIGSSSRSGGSGFGGFGGFSSGGGFGGGGGFSSGKGF